MKETIFIFTFIFLTLSNVLGQVFSDSLYKALCTNKDSSIFESINKGTFSGLTNGYIQLVNNRDTLLLDFQSSHTTLYINKIDEPVYDDNTKIYATQTTSGKTIVQYETFMLANILTIVLNGIHYSVGVFDGASDMPILGLSFNYAHEQDKEYLTLFVTQPLRLTTGDYLFNKGNISYQAVRKNEKAITVLPGSTLVFTVSK